MLAGVTIRRPETVMVDSQVKVGMDSVIEPFAQLLGNTVVGEDSVIGAGCILKNCQVADRVEISAYTIAQDSRIDERRHDRSIRPAYGRTITSGRTRTSATSSN